MLNVNLNVIIIRRRTDFNCKGNQKTHNRKDIIILIMIRKYLNYRNFMKKKSKLMAMIMIMIVVMSLIKIKTKTKYKTKTANIRSIPRMILFRLVTK